MPLIGSAKPSKVVLGDGTVLADLTADTVTKKTLAEGEFAYGADGKGISGQMTDIVFPSTITAGNTPILMNAGVYKSYYSESFRASGISVTAPKTGTYRCKFVAGNAYTGTVQVQLYVNGTSKGSAHSITSSTKNAGFSDDLTLNAGDSIEIYIKPAGSSLTPQGFCGGLALCIDWYNGMYDPGIIE